MTLFRNVVFVAALAGLVAGVVLAALQTFTTVPLIVAAEVYENTAEAALPAQAEAKHADAADAAAHDHNAAVPHQHDAEAWSPADGAERFGFNVLANVVSGVGFALLLVALSEFAGGIGGWRDGVFWGLAGFAVFTLAPGLGLQPELPAMPAADLLTRQVWWVGTVLATAAGLWLIAFRRSAVLAVAGVMLIVAPHVIGAPLPDSFESPIPEGLHHRFVVAVTITNLIFWLVLGGTVGLLRRRFALGSEAYRDSFA